MDKKVGIVMPCINLWAKYTRPALDSVVVAINEAEKHGIFCDTLLIDNASADETHDAMMTTVWPNIREGWISYQGNKDMWGFQKSVNFGFRHFFEKGFDYVLILNNDIRLHPSAIVRLVERMERGGVEMVTCLDVTGECSRDPGQLNKLADKEKEACPETPHPCFSAFMVTPRCWHEVGEFDEVFHPAYYEDNDYHYRMQLAGALAITYPPAMFFHWGSATQMEALGGHRRLTDSANQHAQYIKKWGGDPGKEVFKSPYNNPEIDLSMIQRHI